MDKEPCRPMNPPSASLSAVSVCYSRLTFCAGASTNHNSGARALQRLPHCASPMDFDRGRVCFWMRCPWSCLSGALCLYTTSSETIATEVGTLWVTSCFSCIIADYIMLRSMLEKYFIGRHGSLSKNRFFLCQNPFFGLQNHVAR